MTKCQTKLVKKNFSTFFMLKIDRNHKNKILKKKIFFKKIWGLLGPKMAENDQNDPKPNFSRSDCACAAGGI